MPIYTTEFMNGINAENPWWFNQESLRVPSFKRSDYDHYIEDFLESKINVLLGPRRCGKTTIIKQLINNLLLEQKIDPKRILFVSLDRPFLELQPQKLPTVINYYEEKILGHSIQDSKELIYLFVDEAHYDPMWSKVFKQYVDQNLPIYSIISGSSAPSIYQGQESAAGRFHIHQMVTMKFRDVVRWNNPKNQEKIKEISKKLREALLNSIKDKNPSEYVQSLSIFSTLSNSELDSIKKSLEEYLLKGGYPEFYSGNKSWKENSRHYQTDVFDVILQKDVVTISNLRQSPKVRTLLVLIAQNTAKMLTREKIRESLGFQSAITVDQYVDALAEAFLIRTSVKYKVGGYPSTKPKKYYAGDNGLRNSILSLDESNMSTEERGALLETAVFNHCLRLQFHVDRTLRTEGKFWEEETEKDIILDFMKNFGVALPVEVKNGHGGQEDIRATKIVVNKLGSPFGILICNDKIGLADDKILLLPAWAFLLSC